MMWDDYDLEGVSSGARHRLPVQTAARVSPGTGISAMQMSPPCARACWSPGTSSRPRRPKTALRSARTPTRAGWSTSPTSGCTATWPRSISSPCTPASWCDFNISPETVGAQPDRLAAADEPPSAARVPELNLWIDRMPGLVPQTLAPLLQATRGLQGALTSCTLGPAPAAHKARAAAHKWLLVTCFGYLGYKNARFGRIEAHQAVTAYSREACCAPRRPPKTGLRGAAHCMWTGCGCSKPAASRCGLPAAAG